MRRRDIIVVGTSLGGIQALSKLLGGFSRDLPAAQLVVLHTGVQSPRLLDGILGRCSALPVAYADDGEPVRPGRVYLAPPDRHLIVVSPGVVGLTDDPKVNHVRPAADVLFASAAAVYGSRVIGVVLTGGDCDGADGMRRIKAAGGIGIVQAPEEARDPSMPLNALHHGYPDYVASLDTMSDLITRLVLGSMKEHGAGHRVETA
jgi:two-component system chemotaxis response regulator CheB